MPFELLSDEGGRNHLFYMMRILRLERGAGLISRTQFMTMVKSVFQMRLNSVVNNDKLANNNIVDNNNISKLLLISSFFKIGKLVIFMYILCYIVGMGWYVFCDLTRIENPTDEDIGFMDKFDIYEKTKYEKLITFTYFSFTTLSKVGLGDYYPSSNAERALCGILMMVGLGVFSYILGSYIIIMRYITELNADFEEGSKLSRWLGMMKWFNNGRYMDQGYQNTIETYFAYRWSNDKNIAISTKEDEDLLDQVPDFVQREIYSDYLFREFLTNFRKFFDLPMEIRERKEGEPKIEHAFYKWDNEDYQSFMIQMLKSLEPRMIPESVTLFDELDEVNELLFIELGKYDIGYEVNKMRKFKIRLGAKTVIGAFNICFKKRQIFVYKTKTECSGYFVRKKNWHDIMEQFPDFFGIIKRKVLYEYIT